MESAGKRKGQVAGTRYRFIVKSADEAAHVIREKIGENARVLSVRQVEGRGLAGFLKAPRLEVIAEALEMSTATKPKFAIANEELDEKCIPNSEKERPTSASGTGETSAEPDFPASNRSSVVAVPRPAARMETCPTDQQLERILKKAGFSAGVLARLRTDERWEQLQYRTLGGALIGVSEILRNEWTRRPGRCPGQRIAFFGTPGAGTTTALCKRLTTEVFYRRQQVSVLKLDGRQPNPTDGLAAFCEALGVPLLRASAEIGGTENDQLLYFDVPGICSGDAPAWRSLNRLLDEFEADTRVLVINACYDLEILKQQYQLAAAVSASHMVFTHVDELPRFAKLWDLALDAALEPLFLSNGQNVAGSFIEDVLETLLEKTFASVRR